MDICGGLLSCMSCCSSSESEYDYDEAEEEYQKAEDDWYKQGVDDAFGTPEENSWGNDQNDDGDEESVDAYYWDRGYYSDEEEADDD